MILHKVDEGSGMNLTMEDLKKSWEQYMSANEEDRKEMELQLQKFKHQAIGSGTNLYQELSMMQTDAQIHYDRSITADPVQLHSHTFYEILFCNSGNPDYLIGSNRYHLKRGDILLIPPGVSHRPLFPRQLTTPYERFVLWLDTDFWNRSILKHSDLNFSFEQCEKSGAYLLRTPQPTWEGLLAGFRSLLQESRQQRLGWQLCVTAGALCLMAHISRTYFYMDSPAPPIKQERLLDDIFKYIDTNITRKLTLEIVAGQFFVSKSTVSHLFSEQMGVSFYHCIIQRRLIAAKTFILQGLPLRQVWEQCGFSDYTSFYRLFRKEFGISPKQFRTIYDSKQTLPKIHSEI